MSHSSYPFLPDINNLEGIEYMLQGPLFAGVRVQGQQDLAQGHPATSLAGARTTWIGLYNI